MRPLTLAEEKLQRATLGAELPAVGPEYTEAELLEFAKGVFKDHPGEPAFYVDKYGTFKNEGQYKAVAEDDKKNFTRLANPLVKTASVVDEASAAKVVELQATVEEQASEIERLNGLKSVSAVKDVQTKLDEALAEIEKLKAAQS